MFFSFFFSQMDATCFISKKELSLEYFIAASNNKLTRTPNWIFECQKVIIQLQLTRGNINQDPAFNIKKGNVISRKNIYIYIFWGGGGGRETFNAGMLSAANRMTRASFMSW